MHRGEYEQALGLVQEALQANPESKALTKAAASIQVRDYTRTCMCCGLRFLRFFAVCGAAQLQGVLCICSRHACVCVDTSS